MKHRVSNGSRRRLALVLAFILLASCTLMPTALMQTGRPANSSPVRPSSVGQRDSSPVRRQQAVKIDPNVLRAATRAPIAFKPLEMVDPRTGKAITPDTMLKLDNGRQITAAKYYEQMNKLEAGLNKLGHSFRDQQKEVVTNEVVLDKARTIAQIRSMRFSTPDPKTAARLDAIAQAHRDYIRTVNPDFGKLGPRRLPARVNSGLYQQKVGALIYKVGGATTASALPAGIQVAGATTSTSLAGRPSNLPKSRPDFVPGDSEASDLGKETESLPGISTDPGWAMGGKQASAIEINASWSKIAFYVNYLKAATAPLARRYIWQVAKAGALTTNAEGQYQQVPSTLSLNNFGSFSKAWATEFDYQELVNWKSPPGMIASGGVSFYYGGSLNSEQKLHMFLIDFGQLVGNPPDGMPSLYVVRVVPVNADGSIAGYPSHPVLVSYGTHPEFAPKKFPKLHAISAKIPVNRIDPQAPISFGNPRVMSVDLNTWMHTAGSPEHESATIGFDAGCWVYGRQYPLLKFSAGGEISPLQYDEQSEEETFPGKVDGKVGFVVGGVEIPCDKCTESGQGKLKYAFDKSEPIEESFTLSFPIGPIDVSATVGIRGQAGVGGSISLEAFDGNGPLSISAGPHLNVSVFLEAGVGIGLDGYDLVEVGVEGNVNLISAGFVVDLFIFNFDSKASGYYSGHVSDLKVLNGTLDGLAKAGICPFCKKWTTTLFSCPGYDLLATDPGHATLFEGKF